MDEKKKLAADGKLIEKLFGTVPLDWNRRPNDDLVFLNHKGQKFIYSDKEILKRINASGPTKPKGKSKPAGKAAKKPQPAGAPPAKKQTAEKPADMPAGKAAPSPE